MMAGYRSLPLAPVSTTAAMGTNVAASANGQPAAVPTMFHHQSMTAMSNNGIIYQSAVHASIHSLNTVQAQRSTTTHHRHILATATAVAAAAAAASTNVTNNAASVSTTTRHHHQHHQQQHQEYNTPSVPPLHSSTLQHPTLSHRPQQLQHFNSQCDQEQQQHYQAGFQHHHHHHMQQLALHHNHLFFSNSVTGGQHHPHAHHHRQIFRQMQSALLPLNINGEPIKLPDNLESLPRADSFPSQRHRWNTNEEIAAILISFDKHNEWQSKEVKTRPKSGSLLLYSRKKVRYRRDGYCWKKRKDGKTTREDHMKLKVQGTECIYGCYVHSAILPTFHRRCYWLLQNPDIVLVHYLNVPYPDDNKMAIIAPSITLWGDKKEWTKEELVSQLKPMLSTVTSDDDSDSGNDIEISTAETVESIVCQLMEKQRLSRQAALVKQLDCGCGDASCADGKTCSHPVIRRPSMLKTVSTDKRINLSESYNHSTSSNTPNVVIGPKLYSRYPERRVREVNLDNHNQYNYNQQLQPQESAAIKFQIIPRHNISNELHQKPQQHSLFLQQQQHLRQNANQDNSSNNTPEHQPNRNNMLMQEQHLQTQNVQQQQQNQSNFNQTPLQAIINSHNGNEINVQRFVATHNSNNNNTNGNYNLRQINQSLQIAKTTITAIGSGKSDGGGVNIENNLATNSNSNKMNHNTNIRNNNITLQSHQQQISDINVKTDKCDSKNNSNNTNICNKNNNSIDYCYNSQQHQQSKKQTIIPSNNSHTQQSQIEPHQQFHILQSKPSSVNNSIPTSTATPKQSSNDMKIMPHSQKEHMNSLSIVHIPPTNSVFTKPPSLMSTVEPMCMSPEHLPTLSGSSKSNHSGSNNRSNPMEQETETVSNGITLTSSKLIISDNHCQDDITKMTTQCCVLATQDDNNITMQMSSMDNVAHDLKSSQKNNLSEYSRDSNMSKNTSTTKNTSEPADSGAVDHKIEEHQQNRAHRDVEVSHSPSNTVSVAFDLMKMSNANNNNNNNKTITYNETLAEYNQHEQESLHDSLSYFHETLDLSQEDIQRTLIANLPFDTSSKNETGINLQQKSHNYANKNVSGDGSAAKETFGSGGSNRNPADEDADDVFAHLDAFDMLVEFPELDLDDKQTMTESSLDQTSALVSSNDELNLGAETSQDLIVFEYNALQNNIPVSLALEEKKVLTICDFSPEWSYTEGGVKVLVAGPWTINSNYTVLFDSQAVPTVLIQEGVLRCYCPAHEVGFATLEVSCEGVVISNSALFEYKMYLYQEASFDATSNDCMYKFTLLNRLSCIDERMQIRTEADKLSDQQPTFFNANFEEKLVNYCHQLTKRSWHTTNCSSWRSGFKGMTLLHLSAALGYSKLVLIMLNWRTENPNIILETEIDALSQDAYGLTPLAWACARGHVETASILYRWNHYALKVKSHAQQTAFDMALLKGHKVLVAEIYRWENERQCKESRNSIDTSQSMTILKKNANEKHVIEADDQVYGVKDDKTFSVVNQLDEQRSHDGVFLRPVAVPSNQSPPTSTRFSKRSSVDSGINMDIKSKSGKTIKDINILQSFETPDNFSLQSESPLDTFASIHTTNSLLSPLRKMDFALCEVSTGDSCPLRNKDHDDTSTINNDDITEINTESDGVVGDTDAKVLTLAEHIIAAMPEHIKNEADELMVVGSPMTDPLNSESSGMNDSFMDPLLDSLPNTQFDSDFSFDFNDHNYRYHDVSTPCSSLSPASSGPLQSPASYSVLGPELSVSSPSPPPSTKQLTEFLHATTNNQYPFEADFSKLTLTDTEQRELYEAAKCIQKAYRSYKGRQKLEEQNKERTAAIVIQNYYRRYKQYAYYRQMTNAALIIQHSYRSYCRNKRFKKSKSSSTIVNSTPNKSQNISNSECLSSFYDHFRNDNQYQQNISSLPSNPKETSPSGPLKRTYSQSTQNQAARKIQQFMRQSRIKLQRERAEKEKLVHQRRAEYLRSLQYLEQ